YRNVIPSLNLMGLHNPSYRSAGADYGILFPAAVCIIFDLHRQGFFALIAHLDNDISFRDAFLPDLIGSHNRKGLILTFQSTHKAIRTIDRYIIIALFKVS